jgi:hypothetical protein
VALKAAGPLRSPSEQIYDFNGLTGSELAGCFDGGQVGRALAEMTLVMLKKTR